MKQFAIIALVTVMLFMVSVCAHAQVGTPSGDTPAVIADASNDLPPVVGQVTTTTAIPGPQGSQGPAGPAGPAGVAGRDGHNASLTRKLWIDGHEVVIRHDGTLAVNYGHRHSRYTTTKKAAAAPTTGIAAAWKSAVTQLNNAVFGTKKVPGLNRRVKNLEEGYTAVGQTAINAAKKADEAQNTADSAQTAATSAQTSADQAAIIAHRANISAGWAIILLLVAVVIVIIILRRRRREVGVSTEDFTEFSNLVHEHLNAHDSRLKRLERIVCGEEVIGATPPEMATSGELDDALDAAESAAAE